MLLFKERFKAPILAGVKTVTRRGLKRRFRVGAVHRAYTRPPWVKPPGEPFALLRIVSVSITALREVDEAEARREGFVNLDHFWAYIGARDASMDLTSEMIRIEFEVVP